VTEKEFERVYPLEIESGQVERQCQQRHEYHRRSSYLATGQKEDKKAQTHNWFFGRTPKLEIAASF
jgi:hypothetical protein